MPFIWKHICLHGQIGAAGIGDVDAVQPALAGNGLGPQVLFQGDRKIGAGFHPAVIGNDHGPVAVNLSYSGHNAPAGHIGNPRVIHAEPGNPA